MRMSVQTVKGKSSRNTGTAGYEPKCLYVGSTCYYPGGLIAVTILKCIIALIITRDINCLRYPALTSKSMYGPRCSLITSFVRTKPGPVPTKSERYSILNKCLGSDLTLRHFSDGHCYVDDQRLCLILRRFYDSWYNDLYVTPTNFCNLTKMFKGLMKDLREESMKVNHTCTSFFSLGSSELVQDLRFVTTDSNPCLLSSEVLDRSKLFTLVNSFGQSPSLLIYKLSPNIDLSSCCCTLLQLLLSIVSTPTPCQHCIKSRLCRSSVYHGC